MALHKDLSGADLHEPKGIESAAAGTVYVADGSSSGNWEGRYDGLFNANKYSLTHQISDISTASSQAYFYIFTRSQLMSLNVILKNAITTANAVLSVYVNGSILSETLTVPQSTSSAGASTTLNFSNPPTIPAGSIVEVRSDGASDTAAVAFVTLDMKAVE